MLTADLDGLSLAALQAHVLELRAVAGRLLGRADQVLAVLHDRSGGQVVEHSGHDAGGDSEASSVRPLGTEADPAGDAGAPGPAMPVLMSTQTWWREATRVAGVQAGRDLRRAETLSRFPVWGQAVTDGLLSPAQAQVLCRLDGKLPVQDLLDSQAQLVAVAAALNPVELASWVRHLIATWCEPELDREQDKAEAGAWLQLDKRPDGRLAGRFIISSEDSEAFLTVLEPLSRPQGLADGRSAGRRRADALVEVFTAATKWLDLPSAGGRAVHVSYVVPAGWASRDLPPSLIELIECGAVMLLGSTTPGHPASPSGSPPASASWSWDPPPEPRPLPVPGSVTKPATHPDTGEPLHPIVVEEYVATAAWSGPQTRARIENVLCDARISRVLRDTLGQVVSLQSLTDEITTAQRKAVSARDRHCVARGCTRPPAFTDLHHLVHREDGGTTEVGNLVLLCRRHHVMWHRGRITLHDVHVPWLHTSHVA